MKNNLNFFTVDPSYVAFLQAAEIDKRGFSRVPNMGYTYPHKQKFLCGIVLSIHDCNYFVPVSSFKQKRPDNFLIVAKNGNIVSSLRFNYMFPIPDSVVSVRSISNEPDPAYRTLLAQELAFCIRNQDTIRQLALRTYNRVILGNDLGLVHNSCDFRLLEAKCLERQSVTKAPQQPAAAPSRPSMSSVLNAASARANSSGSPSTPAPVQSKKRNSR